MKKNPCGNCTLRMIGLECGYCGTNYESKTDAEECEAFHKKKLKIIHCEGYRPVIVDILGFPNIITVEAEDGEQQKYRMY